MEGIQLAASRRQILGKGVKSLRRQGITPAHLFGAGVESIALQCNTAQLRRVLASAGRTRLISLGVDGERRPREVVVRHVQREPVGDRLLHVDLYQVSMTEQMRVEVPIVLVGEAPVLKSKEYMLDQETHTVHIESLPSEIPSVAELDVGSLSVPEQTLQVKDIRLGQEVAVLDDAEQVVVRIRWRLATKTEEPPIAEESVEPPEAAAPVEGEARGEQPSSTSSSE